MNQQLITVQGCLQNLLLGSKQGSATAVNCKQRNKTRGKQLFHFYTIVCLLFLPDQSQCH